jgi:superfamily I DNA/RNA helicase/mRNA-degrading endonuclease RelE of RelBE toxin-antitoxin system
MQFVIAKTFADSLCRLTGEEQKAVKVTIMDLQLNPATPGNKLHKLDKARDKRFWSARVSSDIRLILHRTDSQMTVCYVGHHDDAYDWAERRKLETNAATGSVQLVEIRETVQNIMVPNYVVAPEPTPEPTRTVRERVRPMSERLRGVDLTEYGVPPEWLPDVLAADSDDAIQAICGRLPSEAGEAVLEVWIGGTPSKPEKLAKESDPFTHPDAGRTFRVIANREELERALESPWDRWAVFLHPEQRQWVEREFSGPSRVSGSAGTGKTIVALHRAAHVARRDAAARVLLTTFSDTLAHALSAKLRVLIGMEPRVAERLDVESLDAVALRMYTAQFGAPRLVEPARLREWLSAEAAAVPGHRFQLPFLVAEWDMVVDAWQLTTWEGYRDVDRLGRRTRLPVAQREVLWKVFERVLGRLRDAGVVTMSQIHAALTARMAAGELKSPYDHVVVDEAQDVGISQLRFLGALTAGRPDGLFFAGDTGQRIFQQPFSWKKVGVDIRGRSRTLRVNYRTSHQIRSRADRLLAPEVQDVDGNAERRDDTVSVFNGVAPVLSVFDDAASESDAVGEWMRALRANGCAAREIALIVRSEGQMGRARAAASAAGERTHTLDSRTQPQEGAVSLVTMHLAKGLEFRAIAVMACDDDVIPLRARIEEVGDPADLGVVLETERHLLYVACTRARDFLMVSGVRPESEFLGDLVGL